MTVEPEVGGIICWPKGSGRWEITSLRNGNINIKPLDKLDHDPIQAWSTIDKFKKHLSAASYTYTAPPGMICGNCRQEFKDMFHFLCPECREELCLEPASKQMS